MKNNLPASSIIIIAFITADYMLFVQCLQTLTEKLHAHLSIQTLLALQIVGPSTL